MKHDEELAGAVAVIVIVAGLLTTSYLVTTALVWVGLQVLNSLWEIEVSTNLWLLSLLVWLSLALFRSIFIKPTIKL